MLRILRKARELAKQTGRYEQSKLKQLDDFEVKLSEVDSLGTVVIPDVASNRSFLDVPRGRGKRPVKKKQRN